MKVNDKEYLEKPGLSVLAFHDFYPTGSQGGIEIIQHGERIAANGFIRMQPVNGKRIPDPRGAMREIDSVNNVIKSVVSYEDFGFKYAIRIWPDGNSIRLAVDLDKPLPKEWEKKLTFDLNFFPPLYVIFRNRHWDQNLRMLMGYSDRSRWARETNSPLQLRIR
jgi:hypothetical protein